MEKVQSLDSALKEALTELEKLTPPIVRLSGPLRTGGDGEETNRLRFQIGEALLASRGLKIFSYDRWQKAIQAAYDKHYELFHIPILESKKIDPIFFLPGWEGSGGASYERELCAKLGIGIEDLTREELSEFESTHRDKK